LKKKHGIRRNRNKIKSKKHKFNQNSGKIAGKALATTTGCIPQLPHHNPNSNGNPNPAQYTVFTVQSNHRHNPGDNGLLITHEPGSLTQQTDHNPNSNRRFNPAFNPDCQLQPTHRTAL